MLSLIVKKSRRILLISLLFILLSALLLSSSVKAAYSDIIVLHVDGTINPVLVDYIERGIDQAEVFRLIPAALKPVIGLKRIQAVIEGFLEVVPIHRVVVVVGCYYLSMHIDRAARDPVRPEFNAGHTAPLVVDLEHLGASPGFGACRREVCNLHKTLIHELAYDVTDGRLVEIVNPGELGPAGTGPLPYGAENPEEVIT